MDDDDDDDYDDELMMDISITKIWRHRFHDNDDTFG